MIVEFGIFNLMGARDPRIPTAQVFAEVVEKVALADKLGYSTAWFAGYHFSNYCMCASPLMMVAHCAASTRNIRLGTAVVVVPLYSPVRLIAEIASADAMSGGRLMLGIGAGYQPYEFERFGVDIKDKLEMTDEFLGILDLAFKQDFFSYDGRPRRRARCRPSPPADYEGLKQAASDSAKVVEPGAPRCEFSASCSGRGVAREPIYVAGHTVEMFRAAARHGYRVITSGRSGGLKVLADQYADFARAFAAENVPVDKAHMTVNRFALITNTREKGLRFAENWRPSTTISRSAMSKPWPRSSWQRSRSRSLLNCPSHLRSATRRTNRLCARWS
jgi:alkanesulfonate monooxygenase SsuD/methylene tetrahydromethanopterin reductase-like flavin-dependent oxidoreductase (luciferase family)